MVHGIKLPSNYKHAQLHAAAPIATSTLSMENSKPMARSLHYKVTNKGSHLESCFIFSERDKDRFNSFDWTRVHASAIKCKTDGGDELYLNLYVYPSVNLFESMCAYHYIKKKSAFYVA